MRVLTAALMRIWFNSNPQNKEASYITFFLLPLQPLASYMVLHPAKRVARRSRSILFPLLHLLCVCNISRDQGTDSFILAIAKSKYTLYVCRYMCVGTECICLRRRMPSMVSFLIRGAYGRAGPRFMDCQGKKTKKEKIPSHLRRATYKLLDTRTPTSGSICGTATCNSLCVSIRLLFFYSAVTLRACPALTWIQEYGKDHGAKGRGNRRERERENLLVLK